MDFGSDKNGRGSHSSDTFTEILHFVKDNRWLDFTAYRFSAIGRRLMHRTLPGSRFAFALPTEGRAHA